MLSRVPVRLRGVVLRFDSRMNAGDLGVEIGSKRVVPVDVDELTAPQSQ